VVVGRGVTKHGFVQIVTNSNTTYAKLLNAIDFYVLPMFNPDGYEYALCSTVTGVIHKTLPDILVFMNDSGVRHVRDHIVIRVYSARNAVTVLIRIVIGTFNGTVNWTMNFG